MVVNKAHYARDEKAFLPHGSAVRIGPVNFYFHLPPQPGQEHAPVALPSSSDDEDDSIHAGGNGAAGGGSEGEDGDGGSRGVFGGGGGDGGDDMSRASSAVAGGGRSSLGGGGGGRASTGGKMTYSELVFKAFASPDLAEAGRTQGLTSSDVTGWITAKYVRVCTCVVADVGVLERRFPPRNPNLTNPFPPHLIPHTSFTAATPSTPRRTGRRRCRTACRTR